MSKITRQALTRGTKLSAQHFNGPMAQVQSALNSATVASENLELNNSNFSITLNFPRLPAYAFGWQPPDDTFDPSRLVVPFVLPPTQDKWTKQQIGDGTPMPILRSMSISLDLGMGPNGVLDAWDCVGQLPPVRDSIFRDDDADMYNIELEIRSKDQAYVYGLSSDVIYNVPKEVIYKTTISSLLFRGEAQQFNPIFIDGLDEVMNPLKTYVLFINFPNVWKGKVVGASTFRYAISSLTVKLNFEGPLLPRDQYDSVENKLQNMPVAFDGGQAGMSVALDTALPSASITARIGAPGSGRIQNNIEVFDDVVLAGLPAGRDIRSATAASEPITYDTGYTVLAVPMFGGWNDVRSEDINEVGLPYGPIRAGLALAPWNDVLQDRRIIPISQGLVIHQVIAVHNHYSHFPGMPGSTYPGINTSRASPPAWPGVWLSGLLPTSPTFTSTVGVGICTGLRSDSKQYEEVAYASWTPATRGVYSFDRVKAGTKSPGWGDGTDDAYDIELFQIPLSANILGGTNTRGYRDQGAPYYVGKSGLASRSRTVVGTPGAPNTTRNPLTAGGEQFIEVRWTMSDINGLNAGAGIGPRQSYIGMGGNWVYLICKTEVAATRI